MADNTQHYHSKGQKDASDGKYSPPHGLGDSLITWSSAGMQKNIEENDAYKEGHYHTQGQIDASEGRYNAAKAKNEAYKESWRSTRDEQKRG